MNDGRLWAQLSFSQEHDPDNEMGKLGYVPSVWLERSKEATLHYDMDFTTTYGWPLYEALDHQHRWGSMALHLNRFEKNQRILLKSLPRLRDFRIRIEEELNAINTRRTVHDAESTIHPDYQAPLFVFPDITDPGQAIAPRLTHLELNYRDCDGRFPMLFVLPMLRHSPNLVTLKLTFLCREASSVDRQEEAVVHLARLTTLVFQTWGGEHTYFLSRLRAPALKRMAFKSSRLYFPADPDRDVAVEDVAELVRESAMKLEEIFFVATFSRGFHTFNAIYPLISESITRISGLSVYSVLNAFSREPSVSPSTVFPRLRFVAANNFDMVTLGPLVAVLDQLPDFEELVLETGSHHWEGYDSLRLSGGRKIRFVEKFDELD